MKRMKKFVLILTASMVTISLAGCGSSPTKSPQPQTEEAKQGTLFPEFQEQTLTETASISLCLAKTR